MFCGHQLKSIFSLMEKRIKFLYFCPPLPSANTDRMMPQKGHHYS